MFKFYSELSLHSLMMSKEYAKLSGSQTVSTGHLLASLSVNGSSTAGVALGSLEFSSEQLREELCKPITACSGGADFSPGVIQALLSASHHRRRFDHPQIYTGHILLGLVNDADQLITNVLSRLGVIIPDFTGRVQKALEESDARLQENARPEPAELTSDFFHRANDEVLLALTFAEKESRCSGHAYICSEHLLLGLLTVRQSPLIASQNAQIADVVNEIERSTESGCGWTSREPMFSKRAVAILNSAANCGPQDDGSSQITLAQVSNALAQESKGTAAKIIKTFGIDLTNQ